MHRITEKNAESRTGTCAICGPVKLYKKGSSFICATRRNQRTQAWVERNPDAASANKKKKSEHSLSSKDVAAKTGECPVCGPTEIMPYGRGWACVGSPAAKRRQVQEAKPQRRCVDCGTWCGHEVRCPTCIKVHTPGLSLGYIFTPDPTSVQGQDERSEVMELAEAGIYYDYQPDPYHLDDHEAVKPWRVLGEGSLKDVRLYV